MLKHKEKGKICIIKEASHKWKDVASFICYDHNKIRVLEQQHPGDPHECLRQTFINDFLDKNPKIIPMTGVG